MSLNANQLLYFNGVDGTTGAYDLPPISAQQLLALISGEELPDNLAELHQHHQSSNAHYGVKALVNAENLDEAGWGAVFPSDTNEAVIEALTPLLNLRKSQAGERFRIYKGDQGVLPDESKTQWLARHGMAPGPADPDVVPYYLMLVADPVEISFMFQYQLDVQYAVGRLHLETVEDYANYAQTVVAAETGAISHSRRVTLMGTEHEDDRATQLSSQYLVKPLAESLKKGFGNWDVESYTGASVGKDSMNDILTGDKRPALLFTASHGMSFPSGDLRQSVHQGALLCGEWPGPKNWRQPVPQDFYLAADDIASDSGPSGMVTFCHACFGAGVPTLDNFSKKLMRARKALAPSPFVSKLPQRLLSHPKGGALAVVGHIDRAWSYSFDWPEAGRQTAVFESAMSTLMEGKPIGMAMEYFNSRYAELATTLTADLEEIEFGKRPNFHELTANWTAHNDARAYVVLGDPAVRLSHAQDGNNKMRDVIFLQTPNSQDAEAIVATPPDAAATDGAPVKAHPTIVFAMPKPPEAELPSETVAPPEEPKTKTEPEAVPEASATDNDFHSLRENTLKQLQTAFQALDNLDVRTAVADPNGEEVLFAHTHIDLKGHLKQVITPNEDDVQWTRHLQTVKAVLENRTAMLEAISRILEKSPE